MAMKIFGGGMLPVTKHCMAMYSFSWKAFFDLLNRIAIELGGTKIKSVNTDEKENDANF